MKLKKLLPSSVRLRIRLMRRILQDRQASVIFAGKKQGAYPLEPCITEVQAIKPSNYYENKVANIRLGAKMIEEIIIEPGETLSFWKAIGNPTPRQGFKIGRNLIDGKLAADYGGGLCQLSGIIYLAALKGGLDITERHNHTVDIYKEEERFTPLGSDATVVYAYKDLRVMNTHRHPIRFVFEITDNSIECRLTSTQPISPKEVSFTRSEKQSGVVVDTYRDGVLCDTSYYLRNN